ncbi:MAG TPA: hypothetical protein VGR06_01225 [Actinophytocola sp.]|jgi:hypothetical protein|nr:hypothetical protein [Actinophytocola sp.]
MDERKLGELFSAAVPNVPPPSFNHRDVVAESHRVQAQRRRTALLGGSALGIAILAGAAVIGVALWTGTDANTVATSAGGSGEVVGSTRNAPAAPNEVPREDASPSDKSLSAESPKQGGTPTGNAGPPGPGTAPSGCEKADPELAAALAGELRAADSTTQRPPNLFCPPNSRGVALPVTDASGNSGLISLVVAPKEGVFGSLTQDKPQNTELRTGTASGGRHVVLLSEPGTGSVDAPFEFDLQNIVDRLAKRI